MNDTCKKWRYSRIRDWNLKRKVKNCNSIKSFMSKNFYWKSKICELSLCYTKSIQCFSMKQSKF